MVLEISREELRRRFDSGENLVIVEALPALYYEDAHLPGALNLPHDQVDELAPHCCRTRTGRWPCTALTGRARTP